MRNRILIYILLTATLLNFSSASASDVNAARLVQKVRDSENWIHKVDSLYIRMESKWTQITQAKNSEDLKISERILPSLQQTHVSKISDTGPVFEFAFDQKRARYLNEDPHNLRQLKVWDGSQLTTYEKYIKQPHEQYIIEATLQGSFPEFLARDTAWPKAQPHSFWFDTRDTAELLSYFGKPEEFTLKGNENYRGVDCFVLEFLPKDVRGPIEDTSAECAKEDAAEDADKFGVIGQVQGLADQVYRWYVGKQDGLLHGLAWVINGKTHAEYWMSDYRQVSSGCWFPMTQGYEIAPVDNFLKPLDRTRRDFKTLEIKVNQKLPDELFKIDLKDGVEVSDNRTGRAVIYKYKAPLPGLVGKPIPSFNSVNIKLNDEQLKNKPILVCFFDIDQRPSRNLITELAKKTDLLKEKSVEIISIQISNADKESVNNQIKKLNLPFTVGTINDDEKIKTTFAIKSLPWLILTNTERIVQAEGFSIDELDAQTGKI